MVINGRRDADAVGHSDAFKSGCNVYAVAKNIMWFDDHVADIDADTESNSAVFCITGCEFFYAGLELYSSPNRLYGTRKLCQEPVASVLHDTATVVRDRRRYLIREERIQSGVSGFFVMVHKPRIASHIGG